MSRTYTFDKEQAIAAETSSRITESDAYVGVLTKAEACRSEKGTEGIEFAFTLADERSADYLTLWTYNASGEPLYGLKMLNAMLVCLRQQGVAPIAKTVTKKTNNEEQQVVVDSFESMLNKKIGLVLQKEFYTKRDGSEGYKFNIYACFDAETKRTPKEMLEKIAEPVALTRIVSSLKDKPAQAKKASGYSAPSSNHGAGGVDDPFGDMGF